MFSIVAGVWCVINRLRDFRMTKEIPRKEKELWIDGVPDRDIESSVLPLRSATCKLGKFTWMLLWWQIGLFAAGALLLIAVFAFVYHTKLF